MGLRLHRSHTVVQRQSIGQHAVNASMQLLHCGATFLRHCIQARTQCSELPTQPCLRSAESVYSIPELGNVRGRLAGVVRATFTAGQSRGLTHNQCTAQFCQCFTLLLLLCP